MSKTVWYILGILTVLAGILLFADAPERLATLPPDQKPKFIAGMVFFAGLLGSIAGTCFFPQVRPLTLRILGVFSIVACVFSLVEGFSRGNFSQFPIILVLWLPCSIYLVVKGKLG